MALSPHDSRLVAEEVVAARFIRFLEKPGSLQSSATWPFLVEDHRGRRWVVKAASPKTATNVGNLLSELVSGLLASFLGVPWPRTATCALSCSVISELRCCDFEPSITVGVGTEFLEALQNAPPQKNNPVCYGKAVLDLWVGMDDTKPDQMKMLPDGSLVFLDGDLSDVSRLVDPTQRDRILQDSGLQAFHPSAVEPYHAPGVAIDEGLFEVWLRALSDFTQESLGTLRRSVPQAFGLPVEVLDALGTLLTTRKERIPAFFDQI